LLYYRDLRLRVSNNYVVILRPLKYIRTKIIIAIGHMADITAAVHITHNGPHTYITAAVHITHNGLHTYITAAVHITHNGPHT